MGIQLSDSSQLSSGSIDELLSDRADAVLMC